MSKKFYEMSGKVIPITPGVNCCWKCKCNEGHTSRIGPCGICKVEVPSKEACKKCGISIQNQCADFSSER